MKNPIIFLFAVLISTTTFSQNIIGDTSKEELLDSKHKSWFSKGYDNYSPDEEVLKQLNKYLKKKKYTIEVYFGTWCGDSKREVPKIIKLLEESKFKMDRLKLVGVNRRKQVPNVSDEESKALNIKRVPTLIVYKKGKEINRFVEYAQETLEKDLLSVFTDENYKHSYYK